MNNSSGETMVLRGAMPTSGTGDGLEGDLSGLRATRNEVYQIRFEAQHELEMAKQMRAEAERYRRETEIKARSEAQLLILQARLATKKETAELRRKATEEMQKVLADIRMLRIAAQEELEAQRKFTDVARIYALSQAATQADGGVEEEKEAAGISAK